MFLNIIAVRLLQPLYNLLVFGHLVMWPTIWCLTGCLCSSLNIVIRDRRFDVWLTKAHQSVRTILQHSHFLSDWRLCSLLNIVIWPTIWCLTKEHPFTWLTISMSDWSRFIGRLKQFFKVLVIYLTDCHISGYYRSYMNFMPLCSLISLQSFCCKPCTICLLSNSLLRG